MARAATSRLRFNPQIGNLPVLQFVAPFELQIDPAYQRSIEGGDSQTLIRQIAQHWSWDLCQPLVVSRRADRSMYVIDGQRRLEAARLRGDIAHLPCVVVDYADARDEAASFVHLNQQRRRLTRLDIFKAAVASGDERAIAIAHAIGAAGLHLAPHTNHTAWKPGMISNIGGIEAAWRREGPTVTRWALEALAEAYQGQVLRYAGSVFPGIVALFVDAQKDKAGGGPAHPVPAEVVRSRTQTEWVRLMSIARVNDPNLNFAAASAMVMRRARDEENGARARISGFTPDGLGDGIAGAGDGCAWCAQCEKRCNVHQVASCRSNFCPFGREA